MVVNSVSVDAGTMLVDVAAADVLGRVGVGAVTAESASVVSGAPVVDVSAIAGSMRVDAAAAVATGRTAAAGLGAPHPTAFWAMMQK